jgi:hypothetical protein
MVVKGLRDLRIRYQNSSVSEVLNKTCFLDPRFKSLSFFSEGEREQVVSSIQREAEALEEMASETETEPLEKRQKKESTLMSLLEGIIDGRE